MSQKREALKKALHARVKKRGGLGNQYVWDEIGYQKRREELRERQMSAKKLANELDHRLQKSKSSSEIESSSSSSLDSDGSEYEEHVGMAPSKGRKHSATLNKLEKQREALHHLMRKLALGKEEADVGALSSNSS